MGEFLDGCINDFGGLCLCRFVGVPTSDTEEVDKMNNSVGVDGQGIGEASAGVEGLRGSMRMPCRYKAPTPAWALLVVESRGPKCPTQGVRLCWVVNSSSFCLIRSCFDAGSACSLRKMAWAGGRQWHVAVFR